MIETLFAIKIPEDEISGVTIKLGMSLIIAIMLIQFSIAILSLCFIFL
ncbi:hypothetical protein J2Z42_000007 [Clostridium algifaecis]|uniref:Uncharacterized protein n=1 Tax=Clostridium algifaecis TaxID=1472040 RepID=A0ABS4KMS7_9CLOT|nr:hypothetical protein [Clostridium algifaecis]